MTPNHYLKILILLLLPVSSIYATDYYIDSDGGNNGNTGTSSGQAWKTLDHASSQSYSPGDRILLQRGDSFNGKLKLTNQHGSAGNPIMVAAYGDGDRPYIDCSGYIAGVHVLNSSHIEIKDLQITGDGGAMVDGSAEKERFGVYINRSGSGNVGNVTVDNVYMHDIYPNIGWEHEGANPTTYLGYGVCMRGESADTSSHFVVKNCQIDRMGYKAVEMRNVSFVELLDNRMKDIGGPALQPSRVNDLVVRGNIVDGSGSYIDDRMHGRGSGIWPWGSKRVLIEKNAFMHARGRYDSCGAHIDFNCEDVVVQYNLSVDNAGGFIEILGNNFNCSYRYNISINDGHRVKGELDRGSIPNGADGHTIWTSGYVGSGNTPVGPTNSYIYNNTIYVDASVHSSFSLVGTMDGVLIANNLFYIVGDVEDGTPGNNDTYLPERIARAVWTNNLYLHTNSVPDSFPFGEDELLIGDPQFANPGGFDPEDYVPQAPYQIEEQGIVIEKLPGDTLGLRIGLAVTKDFFGNPIVGLPDIGAVELGGTMPGLPEAGFTLEPSAMDPTSVTMMATGGPKGTEYSFTEVSGSIGGMDSGWSQNPVYENHDLLPNTRYAYSVKMRNGSGQENTDSDPVNVITPKVDITADVVIMDTTSSRLEADNSSAPFPANEWYLSNSPNWNSEGQDSSVNNGRAGYGYDEVVIYWYSSESIQPERDFRFSGNWSIENVLDVHVGLIIGFGEYDAQSGEILKRLKEETVGELTSPFIGQSGGFSLTLTAEELEAAGFHPDNRLGIFIHHDDEGNLYSEHSTIRNDVYTVDNLEFVMVGLDPDQLPELNPVASIQTDVSGHSVTVPGQLLGPGRLCILDHSASLDEAFSWSAIEVVDGDNHDGEGDLVFQQPAAGSSDFFRVRIEWQ
ncbi:MAG: right-handed parallel beta-helix repeat-containing protein [Puniceicoccaceae bacterium]